MYVSRNNKMNQIKIMSVNKQQQQYHWIIIDTFFCATLIIIKVRFNHKTEIIKIKIHKISFHIVLHTV